MKSKENKLQDCARKLVAQKLDAHAALEDAVALGISTEAYAVAIFHYVSDVLVTVFGMTPDDIAANAAKLARKHDAGSVIH